MIPTTWTRASGDTGQRDVRNKNRQVCILFVNQIFTAAPPPGKLTRHPQPVPSNSTQHQATSNKQQATSNKQKQQATSTRTRHPETWYGQ